MPTQLVDIPGLGEVLLAKRRGTRHIKLSVTPRGVVRVSLPYWVPYSAGVNFARSKSQWALKQKAKYQPHLIADGSRIGKTLTVAIGQQNSTAFRAKVEGNYLRISLPTGTNVADWQAKLSASAEKALKNEASASLPARVEHLARSHGFSYESLKIRKMTSRWGSCTNSKHITLSYYLVQLPWELVDYVIVHELLHTRFMHHGVKFWQAFEAIMPGAKEIRKNVNSYRPALVVAS